MDLNVTNEAFFEKDYAYWLIVCTALISTSEKRCPSRG